MNTVKAIKNMLLFVLLCFAGTIVDAATQNSFSLCLKTLRILAKFLGFIESLPYKTETAPNESVLSTQISIRQAVSIIFPKILQ